MRIEKNLYYLNIAKNVLRRGTCLRRNYGSIIVKNDEIIATGYTGAPRGCKNCCDIGKCKREELHIPSGERYELCRSVHSEMNACIQASRKDMMHSTLYLVGYDVKKKSIHYSMPCDLCKKVIINAGIEKIIILKENEIDYEIIEVNNLTKSI